MSQTNESAFEPGDIEKLLRIRDENMRMSRRLTPEECLDLCHVAAKRQRIVAGREGQESWVHQTARIEGVATETVENHAGGQCDCHDDPGPADPDEVVRSNTSRGDTIHRVRYDDDGDPRPCCNSELLKDGSEWIRRDLDEVSPFYTPCRHRQCFPAGIKDWD